jgi:hypothetical protein
MRRVNFGHGTAGAGYSGQARTRISHTDVGLPWGSHPPSIICHPPSSAQRPASMCRGHVSRGWHADDTAVSHEDHGGVCQSASLPVAGGLVVARGDWPAAAEALSGRGCSTAIMHDRLGDDGRCRRRRRRRSRYRDMSCGEAVGWVEPRLALCLVPCALCLVSCVLDSGRWSVVGYRLTKAWIRHRRPCPQQQRR